MPGESRTPPTTSSAARILTERRGGERVRRVLLAVSFGGMCVALGSSGRVATAHPDAGPTPAPAPTAQVALEPASARLAEAASLLVAGDPERALATLSAPTPPLDDYRALLQARALRAAGKDAQAFTMLESIKPRPSRCDAEEPAPPTAHPLYVDATLMKASILEASELTAAAELLAALPAAGDTLAEAAELYRRAGDQDQALLIEARLLTEVPDSPEARALAKQVKAEGIAKRLPTPEQRMVRTRKLLEMHQNAEAKAEANRLAASLGDKSELICELRFIAGKADRKLRAYGSALTSLRAARDRCAKDGQGELASRAGLLEVQVRAIRGNVAETEKAVAWLVKRGGHSFKDDAQLLLANLLDDSGRRDAARKIYAEIADDPKNDQASEAAWRLAYGVLGAEGDGKGASRASIEEAMKRLRSCVASSGTSAIDRARARFWLARALFATDEAKSKDAFEETVLEPSFYAWLALDWLEAHRPPWAKALREKLIALRDAAAATPFLPPATIAAQPEMERARAMSRLGLSAYAEAELDQLSPCVHTDEEALALGLALDEVGAHPRAQQILRARPEMFRGPLTPTSLRILRAAYSRPFFDLVEKAAKASSVEPLFLLALVREESTFDPKIVSWAGATGLSQLMPGTAITAHLELGLGRLDVERLTDPELNLRLGARVLRDGMKDFRDREPLALAAYNGGPGVAKKLSEISPPKPFERWVEEISIRETQRYVKRVLETWGIYRFLYDVDHPFIPLPRSIGG